MKKVSQKLKWFAWSLAAKTVGVLFIVVSVLVCLPIGIILAPINWLYRMTKKHPRLSRVLVGVSRVLYAPFYAVGAVLHFLARLVLGLSYLLLGEPELAGDVFRSLLKLR